MKWFKASLWLLSLLILLSIAAGAVGWFMLRGTPDWYRPTKISADVRRRNAAAVEDKLVNLTNTFGEQNAAAYRAAHAAARVRPDATTTEQARRVKAQDPDQPVVIQFTDDQLNAFFDKWADFQNRRELFDQYVGNPRVIMQKNRLILAGLVKEMDLIVSLEFNPHVDSDGNLRMDLVQVMGGILPLPDSMWLKQRLAVDKLLRLKLPKYQHDAGIAADGYANGAAASAAMNEMILAALHRGSSAAVVFVPGSIERLSPTIPVKIKSVEVDDHTLTLTVEGMTETERQDLLKQIKQFDPKQKSKPDNNTN